jgi:hypothetical protein
MADIGALLPPSPTKKNRRKRQQVPDNLTSEQKEEWRKRNNKEAAQDLRNRRKQYEDDLTARADRLESENRGLELHASRLESDQEALRQKIGLFQQCMSAMDNEQKESRSTQPHNVSLELATAAMDVTDDNDFSKNSPGHHVVVDESAALNPQQSELQRMAPVLILLLGTILSQPQPSSLQAPSASTTTASTSSTVSSTAETCNPSSAKPSSNSPDQTGIRRSRRLAKRPSEVVHPASPCQPAREAACESLLAKSVPAVTQSAPSLSPQALATSCLSQVDGSSAIPELIMVAMRMHLKTIVAKASLEAIKAEAMDIASDPIQSLIPLLAAVA